MPTYKTRIGQVEVVAFSDGVGEFEPTAFWPKIPMDAWAKYPGSLSPAGKFTPNFGCYALRSAGRTILVDTGIGPGTTGLGQGRLGNEMLLKGVSADEVSTVVFTHLHPDHVGWNLVAEDGRPRLTFPKARYLIPKGDWEFFTSPKGLETFPYIKDTVLPLRGLGVLDLIEGEKALTREVTTLPTPGHTPGHISLLITSGGQRGIILGDVAHTPVQAQETDWTMSYDADEEQARQTRHRLFDRLEKEGVFIAAGHFPTPGFGHLVRREGRRYWQRV